MTQAEATAEVFLTALRALSKRQRQAVLCGIADDDELRENLLDLELIAERRHEPSRPFRQYLSRDPKFASIIEESRRQLRTGDGIPSAEVRRRLGLDKPVAGK